MSLSPTLQHALTCRPANAKTQIQHTKNPTTQNTQKQISPKECPSENWRESFICCFLFGWKFRYFYSPAQLVVIFHHFFSLSREKKKLLISTNSCPKKKRWQETLWKNAKWKYFVFFLLLVLSLALPHSHASCTAVLLSSIGCDSIPWNSAHCIS